MIFAIKFKKNNQKVLKLIDDFIFFKDYLKSLRREFKFILKSNVPIDEFLKNIHNIRNKCIMIQNYCNPTLFQKFENLFYIVFPNYKDRFLPLLYYCFVDEEDYIIETYCDKYLFKELLEQGCSIAVNNNNKNKII